MHAGNYFQKLACLAFFSVEESRHSKGFGDEKQASCLPLYLFINFFSYLFCDLPNISLENSDPLFMGLQVI